MPEGTAHSAPPGVVTPLIADLVAAGAAAVWLGGSHARGDAHRHSDIDVGVIAERAGMGPGYRLERLGEHLVSVSWTTADATRASFANPAVLGAAVPGWRRAVALHDPNGIVSGLRAEATAWRWDEVVARADAWVAEQVVGYAEEVHKLVGALEAGARVRAGVQRDVLAIRLAPVLSVHRRILYDTENVLWDLVAEAEGERWRRAQAEALALGGEPYAVSTAAALTLYTLAADATAALLDERQRAVVEHARAIAARAIEAARETGR